MYGYASGAIAALPVPGAGTQTVVPDATVSAGGWTDQLGASTNLHAPLADEDAATYIQSPANPVNATVVVGLGNPTTPGAGDVLLTIDVEQVP